MFSLKYFMCLHYGLYVYYIVLIKYNETKIYNLQFAKWMFIGRGESHLYTYTFAYKVSFYGYIECIVWRGGEVGFVEGNGNDEGGGEDFILFCRYIRSKSSCFFAGMACRWQAAPRMVCVWEKMRECLRATRFKNSH